MSHICLFPPLKWSSEEPPKKPKHFCYEHGGGFNTVDCCPVQPCEMETYIRALAAYKERMIVVSNPEFATKQLTYGIALLDPDKTIKHYAKEGVLYPIDCEAVIRYEVSIGFPENTASRQVVTLSPKRDEQKPEIDCKCEDSTGWTKVRCCNICGKSVEPNWKAVEDKGQNAEDFMMQDVSDGIISSACNVSLLLSRIIHGLVNGKNPDLIDNDIKDTKYHFAEMLKKLGGPQQEEPASQEGQEEIWEKICLALTKQPNIDLVDRLKIVDDLKANYVLTRKT